MNGFSKNQIAFIINHAVGDKHKVKNESWFDSVGSLFQYVVRKIISIVLPPE